MSEAEPTRPRGLRWRETSAGQAVLAPSFGHSFVGGFVLLVNGIIFTVLAKNPQPGKHVPWWLGVLIAVEALVVLWIFLLPFIGGQCFSFSQGALTISTRGAGRTVFTAAVGELRGFRARATDTGYAVFAVRADGEQIPLALSLSNVLASVSNNSSKDMKAAQDAREATYVAARLDRMLEEARAGHGTYRR